jgi:hypothetical protein
VTLPDTLTTIVSYAFYGCTGLTSVTIPNSVTSIDTTAFDGCTGLTGFNVDDGNTIYSSVDGVLFNKNETTLLKYPCCGETIYTIPNSVTSIDNKAFYRCTGLTSVTIPNTVTSIGTNAFYDCTGLTSITIPNSVTSIGNYGFYDCTGLTSVTIPNSVTSIGIEAFYNCTGLSSVYFEHTTSPKFNTRCFYKSSGSMCTFYFTNSTVANALVAGTHYNTSYGTKSPNYSWL